MSKTDGTQIDYRQEFANLIWYLERRQIAAVGESIERFLQVQTRMRPLTRYELELLVKALKSHDLKRAAAHLERAVGSAWHNINTRVKGYLLKAAKSLRHGELNRVAEMLALARRSLGTEPAVYPWVAG